MKGLKRMVGLSAIVGLLSANAAFAKDAMTQLPQAQDRRVFLVTSSDQAQDLTDQRGLGDQASKVRMENLMMVEGSGMQGMRMDGSASAMTGMKASPAASPQPMGAFTLTATIAPNPPRVGANQVHVTVRDRRTQALVKGLKLKAQVYMTIMDMGSATPRVKEVAPGTYALTATFAMKGPWAVRVSLPKGPSQAFVYQAQ